MSLIRKSASERIAFFFNTYTHISKQECDALAEKISRFSMEPTSIQGAFSYTVIGSSEVLQFRAKISSLDVTMIELAKSIHGNFVVDTTTWEPFGGNPGIGNEVIIYRMRRLLGENYSSFNMPETLTEPQLTKQERTMEGLAKFFAQAWTSPQKVSQTLIDKTYSMYNERLVTLEENLPSRYSNLVKYCQSNLSSLFNHDIPWTLTHGDLCDTNLHVDPTTGQLAGVADWAEAEILPFGLSLWGIQTLLGFMDEKKGHWIYFTDYKHLHGRFWLSFESSIGSLNRNQRNSIKIGNILGLLCRHGFKFNGVESITKNETWDLSFLEGQLLGNEADWLEDLG